MSREYYISCVNEGYVTKARKESNDAELARLLALVPNEMPKIRVFVDTKFDWELNTPAVGARGDSEQREHIKLQEMYIAQLKNATKKGSLEPWQINDVVRKTVLYDDDEFTYSKNKPKFGLKNDQILFADDADTEIGKREISEDGDNYYIVFDDWIYVLVKQRNRERRQWADHPREFTPWAEKILGCRWIQPSKTEVLWEQRE